MKCKLRSYGRLLLVMSSLAWGAGCGRFPQDPRHTLEHILERGTLRVGVVESSPWMTSQPTGSPGGPEGRLLADFANELAVDVEWRRGSAEEHFEALARYELDVVAGGVTKSNPWSKHAGFTIPYYTSHAVVAVPVSAPMISDVEGMAIAVHPESGLRDLLEDRGAEVAVRADLAEAGMAVATESWEVSGMGYQKTGIRLRERKHVMAVPPGENAFLMRLEDFLLRQTNEARIGDLLWEEASR